MKDNNQSNCINDASGDMPLLTDATTPMLSEWNTTNCPAQQRSHRAAAITTGNSSISAILRALQSCAVHHNLMNQLRPSKHAQMGPDVGRRKSHSMM